MGSVGLMKNTTLICGILMAESVEELVNEMNKAKSEGADVVEIPVDCIKNFQPKKDLQILLKNKPLPVIISHGQNLVGQTHSLMDVLILAEEFGADYIEFDMKVASLLRTHGQFDRKWKSKIIVSSFVDTLEATDDDLSNLVAQMQSTGADIIKIVANTTYITESARLFHLLSHCQVPLIAYATGDRGLISQLLNPKFGGFLVYGSLEEKPSLGMLTINSLRKVYKVDNIDSETKVFGLISKPVKHSKGPLLHNPTLRYVNYNGIYVPMLVDDLKEFFSVYSDPDFAGFSVGIPYKEAVLEFCDEVHPLAQNVLNSPTLHQRIGAVNTIIRQPLDGKLIGYNTDCEASITAIEDALKAQGCTNKEELSPSMLLGKMFVVVGAGGAGRALAFGAQNRGARVIIFDIDFERASSLAKAVGGEPYSFDKLCHFQPEQGAILANATPIGMHPNKDMIPVAKDIFKIYKLVFDAVYNPRMTTLLREAKAAGCIAVSGVEMFLRQAIGQFNLFTGDKAPEEFMRDIIMEKF